MSAAGDIEELCSICEPVVSGEESGVMRYPMKVEKKRAREESDVVNVIEWASPSGKRFFLLARRPDTGTKQLLLIRNKC